MTRVTVDCGHVIRELWDWLDGEMAPDRLDAIREHLAICRGCRSHMAFARTFLEHVHAEPQTDQEVESLLARVRELLGRERS